MGFFTNYSNRYECSLVDAFLDRDFPMTSETISKYWKEETGRDITKEELEACRPDSQEQVENELKYLAE